MLGESEVTTFLRESYRPDATYGSAFAQLFTKLFDEWGVILLDASDPELNAVAEPIYRGVIERAAELEESLLARGRELEAAGYHQQVKVTPSSTFLFTLKNGARVPMKRDLVLPPNLFESAMRRSLSQNCCKEFPPSLNNSAPTCCCGPLSRTTYSRLLPIQGDQPR